MFTAVKDRIAENVPELNGRIEGAANFSELVAKKALPEAPFFAHIMPLSIQASPGDAAAGLFRQPIAEGIGVLLTIRADGGVEKDDLDDLRKFIFTVINAVAGWAPNDEVGVFELRRGQLMSVHAGAVVYKLDFSIMDQLRIFS